MKDEHFDNIPMNSPEYLKRFQTSFTTAALCRSSALSAAGSAQYLLFGSASGSFTGSFRYLFFTSGSGSFLTGSGSGVFCGLGYGLDLI
ncbi:MAG: hypothetical protein ACI4JX_06945 [Oscillospiraceae bacterium]